MSRVGQTNAVTVEDRVAELQASLREQLASPVVDLDRYVETKELLAQLTEALEMPPVPVAHA